MSALVRVRLRPEPASVGEARRLLRNRACPGQDPQAREAAVLLVSELVTNAVRHGLPPIELEFTCSQAHVLEVRVHDAGLAQPVPSSPSLLEEHGRGLLLTALLSDDWGIEPAAVGKIVWFHLRHPLRRSPPREAWLPPTPRGAGP